VVGLRDCALIGVMVFTFARISAACGLNVADIFHQQRRLWVRLHEKGGKLHEMPCHHTLEGYGANAPVPATLRAHSIDAFNKQLGADGHLLLRWVGRPGRHITKPPSDPEMAQIVEGIAAALAPKVPAARRGHVGPECLR
jgi:integrase